MVVWLFVMANSVTSQSCFVLATAFLLVAGSRPLAQRRWVVHVLALLLIAFPIATLFIGVGGDARAGEATRTPSGSVNVQFVCDC